MRPLPASACLFPPAGSDVKPIDLAELIQGMLDLVQRSLTAKTTIETPIGQRLATAMTDSNHWNGIAESSSSMPALPCLIGGRIVIGAARQYLNEPQGRLRAGPYVDISSRIPVKAIGRGYDDPRHHALLHHEGFGKGTGLGLSMVQA